MAGGDGARGHLLYGRRHGRRLRPGRRDLLRDALPTLAIALPETGPLMPAALFPRPVQAVWLEVGFGNGEHLAAQAAAHPEIGFIGCEPYVNGVSMLLRHATGAGLDNVRIHPDDARPLIEALPEGCLGRVHVLFPDPWPKSRHHRRRFLAPDNLDRLARVMADGAELRTATDHAEYGRWILAHALAHADFDWLAAGPADWRQRPLDETPTRYEEKALAAGRHCLYFRFRRRSRKPPGGEI